MSTPVYCTPKDVARICQLTDHEGERAVFGQNITLPSYDEVVEFILDAEETLEDKCTNAWGTRTIQVSDEVHDIWQDQAECSIHLNIPNVLDFDEESPNFDSIKIWYNNTWTEWLTARTEGRGEDFWVDYTLGKIYFLRQRPPSGRKRAKITYRYNGGDVVPRAIKQATALLVGIALANSPQVDISFPDGGSDDITVKDMINIWQEKIAELIEKYELSNIPVGMSFDPIDAF